MIKCSKKSVVKTAAKLILKLLFNTAALTRSPAKFSAYLPLLLLVAFFYSNAAFSTQSSISFQLPQATNNPSHENITDEIVFIDAAVAEQAILLKALQRNVEVVLLPADEDGFAFIAKTLQQRTGVDAVHIVSHGDVGQLLLGSAKLNSNTLKSYQAEIITLRDSLASEADILLYGCNVSQGSVGEKFISTLAKVTDTDIAASSDLTGDTVQGGDWVLESRLGDVKTALVFSKQLITDYKSVLLAPVIGGTVSNQAVNDIDTIEPFIAVAITDADGDNVSITITLDDNAKGVFTAASLSVSGFTGSGPYNLAFSTPAVAQTAIRALVFNPADNRVISGDTESTTFAIDVVDVNAEATSDSATTVESTSINDAPVITSSPETIATENAFYSYTITATDADGENVSYSVVSKPDWLTFTTDTLSGTPDNAAAAVGTFNVTLRATDDGAVSLSTDQSFIITVGDVNNAPVITSTPSPSATENVLYTYTIAASDVDGDNISYSVVSKPDWLTFATDTLSGTPDNAAAAVGTFNVTLRATDDGAVPLSTDQSFTITVGDVNNAPVITSIAVEDVTQGVAYSYLLTATDADNNPLTYADISTPLLPAWLSFDPGTQVLSGTPLSGDVGTVAVTLSVSDSIAPAVTQSFTITVSNVNDAPVITSVALTSATENDTYTYTLTATDADGDVLTFSDESNPALPGWIKFDTGSGVLSGTPGDADVGTFAVLLRVTDNGAGLLSTDQSFSITVSDVNNAPVIGGTAANQAVDDIATIAPFSGVTIADGDADNVSIAVSLDDAKGTFTSKSLKDSGFEGVGGNPSGSNGTSPFTLPSTTFALAQDAIRKLVFDPTDNLVPAGATVTTTFTIEVEDTALATTIDSTTTVISTSINDAPVIGGTVANQNVNDNATIAPFSGVTITDIDGDNVTTTITLDINAKGVLSGEGLSGTGPYTLASSTTAAAETAIRALVFNPTDNRVNAGQTETTTFTLLVTDGIAPVSDNTTSVDSFSINDAPVITSEAVLGATQDVAYSYTLTATDVDSDLLVYADISDPPLPAWLSFNPDTQVLSGTPLSGDIGTVAVALSVNDGIATAEIQSFTITVANVNDLGVASITGTASQGETLSVSVVDIDGTSTSQFAYVWKRGETVVSTDASYLLGQADVDNIITVIVNYIDDLGGDESATDSTDNPVTDTNDLGIASIDGTLIQGSTLKASVTDADGTKGSEFSYQWSRNGVFIEDATTSSYFLVQADVGKSMAVTIDYIDEKGTAESVTSDATALVGNTNDAGSVSITGIAGENHVLTAVIVDPDGTSNSVFSYQWKRGGTVIGTASTYTPVQSDIDSTISVSVSYIDDLGTTENITSNASAIVFADLDGDGITDAADPDIDGDGMPNNYEIDNGLDPRDPADADGDLDGDGRTNLEEFLLGSNLFADDNPPEIFVPEDITMDATGWFTSVDIGEAVAVDARNGDRPVTTDNNGEFRPGVNEVEWRSTDLAGNEAVAIQTVNIVPMVELSNVQVSAEGSDTEFRIALNGDAVQYPVTVPYSVSGSAANDGSDHDLCLSSVSPGNCKLEILEAKITAPVNPGELPEVVVPFTIVADAAAGEVEEIIITLGTPDNAILGPSIKHTIKIVEGNVAPLVRLEATQLQVDSDSAPLTVFAIVTDANDADLISYDWGGTDQELINSSLSADLSGGTFSLDPKLLLPGFYTVSVLVDDGAETVERKLVLKVLESLPVLGAEDIDRDSDGDGISDVAEGYADKDSDGVPDYLDAIQAEQVIQLLSGVSDQFIMQTETGLKLSLGDIAFKAGRSGAVVPQAAITTYGSGSDVRADTIGNIGGYFDFTVEGLSVAGQPVKLVIPLLAAVPRVSVYRKLTSAGWQDFAEDENNSIYSAAGKEGYCPPPGHADYKPGLTQGHWCLQLMIEDGGLNDSDGVADNRITDPSGVGQILTDLSVNSSGGGACYPLVPVLSVFIILTLRNKKRVEKKAA